MAFGNLRAKYCFVECDRIHAEMQQHSAPGFCDLSLLGRKGGEESCKPVNSELVYYLQMQVVGY